ncbi:hypothetical protein ETU08_06525 [Apibacter muscae]|uniref:hypothetical protein n=1 Tax=Apibacter muscae TaxID=2509004 RepID=UPI0011AC3AB0|nr:hypothetical protein [Apibacter muscae]TWP30210.1 hypothetical protein ETU08_06525 [Apibacter muscae]
MEYSKWKPYILINKEKVDYIELTTKQFEKIMQDSSNFQILKPDFSSASVYKLSSGNILVSEEGYHTLYRNVDDYRKIVDDYNEIISNHGNNIEILYGQNIYNDKFPEKTKFLVKELLGELDIDTKSVLSIDLLREVEEKAIKSNKIYEINIINFIAIVGETVLKDYKGEWRMELSKDGETWNPFLLIEGKRIEITSYVYEDLMDREEPNLILSYQTIKDILTFDQIKPIE